MRKAHYLMIAAMLLLCFQLNTTTMASCQDAWEKAGITENGKVLFIDKFSMDLGHRQGIVLRREGRGSGEHRLAEGQLLVEAKQPGTIYGACHPLAVSGHFYAEVEFDQDDACGLALIQEKDGQPDLDNFTSMQIKTNKEGLVEAFVIDRQKGKDDVFDHTGQMPKERYSVTFDQRRSLPFDGTNKKIRIFHDAPAGFFHFYYQVKKEIRGEWVEGWMELAPAPDWGKQGQKFYVAVCARADETAPKYAAFDNLRVMQKPTKDQSDANTGFKITRRDYNWSGFSGPAWVITFGDEFAQRRGKEGDDRKFVFWSEMCNIPHWHFNNQLIMTTEFVENWSARDIPGCFEPIADRLLRWSKVKVLEDNDVRKVVQWNYVLCSPNYTVPDNDISEILPEAEELWTIYPNGDCLRHIKYFPKLDGNFKRENELTELIIIAGNKSRPVEHLTEPAMTLFNLEGELDNFHPNKNFDEKKYLKWDQVAMATHFKSEPDLFNVFSHSLEFPGTNAHYPVKFQLTWHRTDMHLVHWPVNKEPYQELDTTAGTFTAQPSHTCLISGTVYGGQKWLDHYQVDEQGRKYREWISLVGLNKPNDYATVREKTAAWLYPGKVTMLDAGCQFARFNFARRELAFANTANGKACRFTLEPVGKAKVLVNPVIVIESWNAGSAQIKISGRSLQAGKDFKQARENDTLLFWIKGRFAEKVTVEIQGK